MDLKLGRCDGGDNYTVTWTKGTHQFPFLDAEHEFNEDFLGLFSWVLEGFLNGKNELVSEGFWHGPVK